jgi:hypothetical protein
MTNTLSDAGRHSNSNSKSNVNPYADPVAQRNSNA